MLTSGELQITDDVTIDGPGADRLSVSGNNASRVFEIVSVHAAISGLTITGGSASFGGGIYNGVWHAVGHQLYHRQQLELRRRRH